MAHEIKENDQMFSVREVPWHGLGNVIDDYPTIEEAIVASGLDWTASLKPIVIPGMVNGNYELTPVPEKFAIVRDDTNGVLGIVGNQYRIYQNSQMWQFIEEFQKESGIKLETAGSLKNGEIVWVLAKADTMEIVKGDPIEEYWLLKNGFTGYDCISGMDTNVRVVCHNTYSCALKGASNRFNVRHTASAESRLNLIMRALVMRDKFQKKQKEALTVMSKYKMGDTDMETFLSDVLFPAPKKDETPDNIVSINQPVTKPTKGETIRQNKIDAVMELTQTGAGTDIKGVQGNAYGLWNAITEWADHKKSIQVREGRVEEEVRFENVFFGTGAQLKMKAFDALLKQAA